jgi:hypothetical protein
MKSFTELVGYDIDRLPGGLMLDHLGVQLDVMGQIFEQMSNWRADTDGWDQVLDLAACFFTQHLQWSAELLAAAIRRAETDFYRSSIMLTREFLRMESTFQGRVTAPTASAGLSAPELFHGPS